MRELRLRSLNVNGGKVPGRAGEIVADLLAEIDEGAPVDFLLLQEVPGDVVDTVRSWSRHWSFAYWLISATEVDRQDDMGLLTLSRYPITRESHVPFENPRLEAKARSGATLRSHDKGSLVTTFDLGPDGGGAFVLANLHALPFWRFDVGDTDKIVRQTWAAFGARMRRVVRRVAPAPIALVGDFNLDDRTVVAQAFDDWDLASTFGSVRTRPDDRSTDDLYVSGAIEVKDAATRDVGSDHFELSALLGVL